MPTLRCIKQLVAIVFLPIFLCFSAFSLANEQAELPKDFFYLGNKLGLNHYQHACESWSLDCDKNSVAAGVFTGYQFNNNTAVEDAYINLGDAKASYLENSNNYQHTGSTAKRLTEYSQSFY